MSSTSIHGSTARNETADASQPDAHSDVHAVTHAAAARVFDHLTSAILGTERKTGRARAGKMLVLNRSADDGHADDPAAGHSTTNVHMGSDGRVLKIVALGRQDVSRPPPSRVSFAEDSVRAAVAKLKFSDPTWADTAAPPPSAHPRPHPHDPA